MLQTAMVLLFVVGILAGALIPGQQSEIDRLGAAASEAGSNAVLKEGQIDDFRERIAGLVSELDRNAELVSLGRVGGHAVGEERFRLRVGAGYHEIGALLSRIESLPYVCRLTELKLTRASDGEGRLDLVVHAPFVAEDGS
ncbi:MAG: hypothetical protein CME06_01395 [Gemmatimonadetes bacterium]|nr:hypothetical protein [Gemmatimonadota bacterium]